MPAFMEPFRIKMVEPIPFLSAQERAGIIREAGYNPFNIAAEHVTIDLFTDSGTGAMSHEQWAALMTGDESYAGARSYYRFDAVLRELTGFRHILPVHQGRAAERILATSLLKPGQITVGNGHFDTVCANIEMVGGEVVDLPSRDAGDAPFQGNLDLPAATTLMEGPAGSRVAAVVMTLPSNAAAGQPVSLAHLHQVRAFCDRYHLPLLLDASRFAENAYIVTQRECPDRRPVDVAKETFRLADGCWASLKKDGLGNIGGMLALSDDQLAAACEQLLIMTEGFSTYGGLAGRDLNVLARGLEEVTDPDYLAYRAGTAAWLADQLERAGMPVVRPVGCHAVYVDAGKLLPHIPRTRFPGWALSVEMYVAGGIRVVEIGSVGFTRRDPFSGSEIPPARETVRFALPRRVYTRSHLEYVAEVAASVAAHADKIPGYHVVSSGTEQMRHFSGRFAPVD